MSVDNTVLGRCPRCHEPIPESDLVIDFQSQTGVRITAATCPGCVELVTLA